MFLILWGPSQFQLHELCKPV